VYAMWQYTHCQNVTLLRGPGVNEIPLAPLREAWRNTRPHSRNSNMRRFDRNRTVNAYGAGTNSRLIVDFL